MMKFTLKSFNERRHQRGVEAARMEVDYGEEDEVDVLWMSADDVESNLLLFSQPGDDISGLLEAQQKYQALGAISPPAYQRDYEKEAEYYRVACLQNNRNTRASAHQKPRWLPDRIRVPEMCRGDGPFAHIRLAAGEYDCQSNSNGAVTVKNPVNDQYFGLMLWEFEVLTWKPNPALPSE